MEEQKQREKDVLMTRQEFEDEKSGNYVKLDSEKDYIIGIHEAKYVRRDFGDGLKPTLVLMFDYFDAELEEPVEFSTSSKFLANMIEEYRTNTDVNLLTWYFKIRKTGQGVQTKYSFTPVKPRGEKYKNEKIKI